MAELTNFLKTLDDKSDATKKTYKTQYVKLRHLLGNDIASVSQKKAIEIIKQQENPNSQQALINIAVLIRKMNKLPIKDLVSLREANKEKVVKQVKEVNQTINLPTLNDLEEYTESLYANNKFTDFIINYLLLNYYVRNKDLIFTLVARKKDMIAKDLNYMWLDVKGKKAVYVRNSYKTVGTYGTKTQVIKDTEFLTALKRVYACQKRDESCGVIIGNENDDNLGYWVAKSTYKGIGEGAYLKVIINAYRNGNDFQKLREISSSRGTNLDTLLSNYSIDLK